MTPYFAVLLLLTIVFAKWGFGYWKVARFKSWWNKGNEALTLGNFVAAEAAFRQCVRLMPIAGPAHRMLGAVLARRGKLAEAEERLRFGADLEPRNPAGFIDLGFLLATCMPDRAEEAIDAFATALEHAPHLRKALAEEARLEPLRRHERFRRLLEPREGAGPA